MTRKRVGLVAPTCFLFFLSLSSNAADLLFSFTSDIGNVSGTVTGEIFGVSDNGTSAATTVELLTWPAGLVPVSSQSLYPTPLDLTAWPDQYFNTFTLVNGRVVSANFQAENADVLGNMDDLFWLDSGPCYSGPTCSYLSLGTLNSEYVWDDIPATFAPANISPEPMSLFSVGGCCAALLLARCSKRRSL